MSFNKNYLPLLLGGGALRPADTSAILQWLNGIEPDALVLTDRKDVVNPEPEVRDVNVISFGGAGYITQPGIEVSPTIDHELMVDWTSGVANERTGGSTVIDDGSNRFYAKRNAGLEVQVYIGTANDWIKFNINASGYTKIRMVGNGDVYKDDVLVGSTTTRAGGVGIVLTGGGIFVGAMSSAGTPIEKANMKVAYSKVNGLNYMPYSTGYGDVAYDVKADYVSTDINVIVGLGQSNMSGQTEGFGTLPAPLQGEQNNYFSWKPFVNGLVAPQTTTTWGPEVTGCDYIRTNTTDEPAVIKHSVGSASLVEANNPTNTWDASVREQRYDEAIQLINKSIANLKAKGYNPIIQEVWWLQGEQDQSSFSEYEQGFYDLRDALISDTDITEDSTFVLGKVRRVAEFTGINNVFDLIAANSWCQLVDVYPYALHDGTHYSSTGMQGLGDAFGTNYVANAYTAYPYVGTLNGVITGGTWETADDAPSENQLNGCSPCIVNIDAVSDGPYIDLGVTASDDIEWELSFRPYSTTPANVQRMGAADGTDRFYVEMTTAGIVRVIIGESGDNVNIKGLSNDLISIKMCGNGDIYQNAILYANTGGTIPSDFAVNIALFDLIAGISSMDCEVFSSKITKSGVVVQDLAALSDGTFRDKVTGTILSATNGTVFSKYLPALGGYDSFGELTTNPGGYVHNGSECSLIQTDADETVFGAEVNFYGNGVDTWDKKTKAEYDAQFDANGDLNLWIKMSGDNVKEAVQYPMSKVFTFAEAEKNLKYFGSGKTPLRDGGGQLIKDVNGYLIYTA